jgi:hypothetical protein
MKYALVALVAVSLAGCHSELSHKNAPGTDRTNAITVVGIPTVHKISPAKPAPMSQPANKRRPGVSMPPVDNSEGAKQAKSFLSMSSQERIEWTDEILKGSGIDARESE